MDYQRILDGIPDYKVFLTVDEMDAESLQLAKDYPGICTCTEVGKSRKGHPIYCLKIGDGPKNAFMFGCPHPNEPMGAMMLTYFSKALCQDDKFRKESGYTWYLIKSIDVDGTQLNEKWFKGPFTLTNYARNYFRPTATEQAEWTFPIDYKTYHFHDSMPETKVLMKIIDQTKPTFLYSLHNAGFGGAYWYLTYDMPAIWDKLHAAATSQDMPLNLGEPEAPYIKAFAPAIYKMTGSRDEYDYMVKYGDGSDPAAKMPGGTSSDDYASQYGTCCLVAELPYFYSEKIKSDKLMGYPRGQAAKEGAKIGHDAWKSIESYYQMYKPQVSGDNPFAKMLDMMIGLNDSSYQSMLKYIDGNPEFAKECKESEAFDNIDVRRFYNLLGWGLCVRGAEFEAAKLTGEERTKMDAIATRIDVVMHQEAAKVEDMGYSLVPIKRLVRIQLESGLIVADYLLNKEGVMGGR